MNNPLHAFVNHGKGNKNKQRELKKQVNKILNDIKTKELKTSLYKDITKTRYGERYMAEVEKRKHRIAFSFDRVSKIVVDRYGITTNKLLFKTRKRTIVDARQEICFLMYKTGTGYSQFEIGRHLGGLDHSTVNHSCIKVIDRIQTIPSYKEDMKLMILYFDENFNFKAKGLKYLLEK